MPRSYLLRVFLSLSCFSLQACIPMGLPEFTGEICCPTKSNFGQKRFPSTQQAIALLVTQERDLAGIVENDREYLGRQYVFGFIPLTRVYLAHKTASLLLEVSLDTLRILGYQPILVSKSALESAYRILRPQIIVEPELKKLALNAYDTFFFRLLRLKGDLLLHYYETGEINRRYTEHLSFSENRWKKYAHAPALSGLLEKSLRQTLAASINKHQTKRAKLFGSRARTSSVQKSNPDPAKPSSSNLILIFPPTIPASLVENAGTELAASYGLSGLKSYRSGQIARLVQRGIMQATQSSNISQLSFTEESYLKLHGLPPEQKTQIVETAVNSLDFFPEDRELKLELDIWLSQLEPSAQKTNQTHYRCNSKRKAPQRDAYWILALESLVLDFTKEVLEASQTAYCKKL